MILEARNSKLETGRSPALEAPASRCAACNDTGWKPAQTRVAGSFSQGVVPCDCRHVSRKERGIYVSLRHTIPISAHELRSHVAYWLKTGRGPTNVPFSKKQEELLKLLAQCFGQRQAIRLENLARALGGVSDRTMKQLVQDLRLVHRIKVGSLRGNRRPLAAARSELAGYFLCLTADDVLATFGTRLSEALTTLEVLDAMTDGRSGLDRLVAEARGFIQQEFSFSQERKSA